MWWWHQHMEENMCLMSFVKSVLKQMFIKCITATIISSMTSLLIRR